MHHLDRFVTLDLEDTFLEQRRVTRRSVYAPAPLEAYMMDHADAFGWNETKKLRSTCSIWTDPKASDQYAKLQIYVQELDEYNRRVQNHAFVPDIRLQLHSDKLTSAERDAICAQVNVHPRGLEGIFTSGQLSYTRAGYVEPLLPPLRHPRFCLNGEVFPGEPFGTDGVILPTSRMNFAYLMDLSYLVHDFATTCQKQTRTSRNIFIDMGASFNFHTQAVHKNPAIYHMELFRQFGFPFDHIYAFEKTNIAPENVYAKLPKHYHHSYHWINLPVSTDPNSVQNPLQVVLDNYNENDLIVIKLDIDTPDVELAMVDLILNDTRYDTLIDHFYFEHHVLQAELARNWIFMKDTVSASLRLFRTLREKGIAAHYWP